MMTNKDLELKLLLRESHIQQLKLKVNNLEDIIIRLKRYMENNYHYVDDIMKQYFDMMLFIIKGVDKE